MLWSSGSSQLPWGSHREEEESAPAFREEIRLPREEVPWSSPSPADWLWPWGKTARPSASKAVKAVP